MKLKFKKTHPDAITPTYSHESDSGMDLYLLKDEWISGDSFRAIDTGIAFEIPDGYEIQIRPRSSIVSNWPVIISLGTVDAGYRGSVKVLVRCVSHWGQAKFSKGERIAQAVLAPVVHAELEEVSELSATDRGEGGLGSSGRF